MLMDELEEAGVAVDASGAAGVMTIKFGGDTFVLNKQAPSQQLWLSSPKSGPWHYRYADGHWLCTRDGHDLIQRLEEEFTALFACPVRIPS